MKHDRCLPAPGRRAPRQRLLPPPRAARGGPWVFLLGALLAISAVPYVVRAHTCTDQDLLALVEEGYDGRIEFDVLRNGKPVGEHVTTFRRTDAGLEARSRMELTVRILRIPVYRFTYRSRDLWCGDDLVALEASVDDNGSASTVRAFRADDGLMVERDGARERVGAGLIPTNHWNPRVLEQDAVLNTITGRVNAVNISRCEHGSPLIDAVVPDAQCHAYSGDLETRAWYDSDGRWVGLAFAGEDGSEIVYVCRRCRGQAGL